MGDIIAELTEEANELLDTTTANWNSLLVASQNAVLPQFLHAVRNRVDHQSRVVADLLQPVPAAVDPAAVVDPAAEDQQQASNSVSGGPASTDSSSEA